MEDALLMSLFAPSGSITTNSPGTPLGSIGEKKVDDVAR